MWHTLILPTICHYSLSYGELLFQMPDCPLSLSLVMPFLVEFYQGI